MPDITPRPWSEKTDYGKHHHKEECQCDQCYPPITPERMSEEDMANAFSGENLSRNGASLQRHIAWQAGEIAELRRSLDVAETAFRVAEKIATASNAERDAAKAECERLAARLAEIDAGAKADAEALGRMRDGTKLSRSGLVQIIAYQGQDIREQAATIAGLRESLEEIAAVVESDFSSYEAAIQKIDDAARAALAKLEETK